MSAQVAADLRAAADVLERDGWTQGQYHQRINGQWCHCVVGATEAAASWWQDGSYFETQGDGPRRSGSMWRTLAEHLNLPSAEGVFDWNDAPDRTADEVIAALRAAADRAEAAS